MSNEVALSFEDGVTKIISVGPYETVMEAAFKARINLPSDCRDGACGTCKSFCTAGTFDPGDFIDDAMTEDELEAGYLLTCQATPESDMMVEIPTTSDVAKTSAATFDAEIVDLEFHADSAISVSLALDDRSGLAFLPGQYMNVEVPGTDEARSYSFSSGPKAERTSFLVRSTPGGAMSTYLSERAEVGDRIRMTGPFGTFFLRPPQRRLLLLAGGTGLAPILSILEKIAEEGTDQPIHLVYGVTRDVDLVGLDRLDEYVDRIGSLSYSCCVSDPESTAEQKGYVTSFIEPAHLAGGDVDIYLCGPPPMVDAVAGWLKSEDITPANFYYERFAPKGSSDDDETGAPPSPETVGDLTPAEAVSTLETGRLSFTHQDSMAHLEARAGLELAVTELMIGRLTDAQLEHFRRLAAAASEVLEGETIVDVEAYAQRNEEFHEYLFVLSDNPAFLAGFRSLEVHNQILEALGDGGWIAPEVDAEHFALVDAFDAGDIEAARRVIRSHNEHARATMSRVVTP